MDFAQIGDNRRTFVAWADTFSSQCIWLMEICFWKKAYTYCLIQLNRLGCIKNIKISFEYADIYAKISLVLDSQLESP